jgi:dehydrogenase/reductase SDR family protein 12
MGALPPAGLGDRLRDCVDDALDATVVLSFTNIGFAARARLQRWAPLPLLLGRRVLVTGANSGLGLAAAHRFADLGAVVHLAVRNAERGERARAEVVATRPDAEVHVELVDMSDLASVRAFAERFTAEHDSLDVLVHNAGALLHERTLSAQGIETTLATHVVGPFLLTALLLPTLERSAHGARVITVASGGMYSTGLDLANLQSDQGPYNGTQAYARAKRAQVLLTEEWARRAAGDAAGRTVSFHAMHPGWADTPGVAESLPRFRALTKPFLRDGAQGADTVVWLAAEPDVAAQSGRFWLDRRPRPTHKVRRTRAGDAGRAELFSAIRELSGYEGALPGDEPAAPAGDAPATG